MCIGVSNRLCEEDCLNCNLYNCPKREVAVIYSIDQV